MRFRLPGSDEHGATDALGLVTAADEASVSIDTKRGSVRIPREAIILVHEVPPAPTRTGRTHEIVSAVDLRRISAAAWLPTDVSWLHAENLRNEGREGAEEISLLQKGWLLRSSGSVMKRANSALPITDAGLSPEQTLDAVEAWYRGRSKPARVQIFSDADSNDLAEVCAPLAPLLASRGYTPGPATLLLTGATAEAAAGAVSPSDAAAPGLRIVVEDTPRPQQYAAWASERDPGSAEDFHGLVEAVQPCQFVTAYAELSDGSTPMIATCRVVERHKWGVITNLVTRPDLRRRGAGRSVVRAAAALLARRGVRSYLVDVEAANSASLGLFGSLGTKVRHRSWYATLG